MPGSSPARAPPPRSCTSTGAASGSRPTFLHHRQESTLEIETGAELHVRLLLAEADLPLATMGERW